MRKFITFTSDFGLEDGWVGVCKGVILNISPDVKIVDISHHIPSFNTKKASFVLSSSLSYMPVGIHLAVVDPGVGTSRRPLVLKTGRGDYLVGPDNGLLIPPAEKLGGVIKAIEIKDDKFMSKLICPTFHARDVFAPVVGYLASEVNLTDIGVEIPKENLAPGLWEEAVGLEQGEIECEVIDIDKFGTIHLNFPKDRLSKMNMSYGKIIEVSWKKGSVKLPFCRTFGDVPVNSSLMLVDSTDYLSLAVNLGSAADSFKLEEGDKIILNKIF
ncbi:MAG TPA: hypothetical protein ENN38_02925 [Actinobacteria bacterium]|nr:hypothetical protein [Actinomycetota bacterium]